MTTAPGQALPLEPSCTLRNFVEPVADRSVKLYHADCQTSQGKHYTGATIESPPPAYFRGEASDKAAAQLQLSVYQTVRFMSP